MGQLEAAAVRGDCPREAGDDAGSQALGVEIERARAFAEEGQIEFVHAVGDSDREDVSSPRVHRPHPRVRHPGYDGGRLAFADVSQRHELAAMRQSEGGVAQKVAHGAKFELRQGRGRALSQCAFEGASESAPAVRGDRLTNHGTALSRSLRFPFASPRRLRDPPTAPSAGRSDCPRLPESVGCHRDARLDTKRNHGYNRRVAVTWHTAVDRRLAVNRREDM